MNGVLIVLGLFVLVGFLVHRRYKNKEIMKRGEK